jgi:anti-sigma B factor antagonist
MPGVELKASVRDGLVVVVPRGDLDATGAADAEAAIAALVAPGQTLIIDISALDFMDCVSLRALLRVQAEARRGGGDIVLAAPQPHVLRLLALTGADELFCVPASVEAAVAGAAAAGRGTRYCWRRLAVRAARPRRAAPSPTCTGLAQPGQRRPGRVLCVAGCADDGRPGGARVGAGGRACRRAGPAALRG